MCVHVRRREANVQLCVDVTLLFVFTLWRSRFTKQQMTIPPVVDARRTTSVPERTIVTSTNRSTSAIRSGPNHAVTGARSWPLHCVWQVYTRLSPSPGVPQPVTMHLGLGTGTGGEHYFYWGFNLCHCGKVYRALLIITFTVAPVDMVSSTRVYIYKI